MALEDQLLYGTYVGLVVDVQDPNNLGRAKVLVPGKNGPLFTDWNNSNTDIEFYSVTDSVFSNVLSRLKNVLPWARPAMPLWGGGTGSFNSTSNYNPYTVPTQQAFGSVGLNGTNGRLNTSDPNQLVPLPGFSGHYANPIVAGKFQELVAAAKADGINLGLTDSYRTYDQQVYLYNTKGPGLAARPGNSNHGWGLAFDFRGTNGTSTADAYAWLRNNASNYGWSNYVGGTGADTRGPGGSQKEPWHWQINKSDLGQYSNYSVNGSGGGPVLGGSLDNRQIYSRGENRTDGVPEGSANFEPTCRLDKSDQYNRLYSILKDRPFYSQGTLPANASTYGLGSATAEGWAAFYTRIAGHESGGDPCSPFKDFINGRREPGGSGGLYQLGRDQIEIWMRTNPSLAREYGLDPNKNYSQQELYNADLNTRGMLFIGEALLRQNNTIAPGQGLGRTIGDTLGKMQKATAGDPYWTNFEDKMWTGGKNNIDSGKLVQRTTNQGVNAHNNINVGRPGQPIGSFSMPAVGAKVYVMFEGGSPQRPIYFAMAYDPSNIQSYY